MKYNYIIYGITNDFYRHSFSDLLDLSNCKLCTDPFDSKIKIFNMLYKAHSYPQITRYVNLPFKSLWNRFCKFDFFHNDNPICFVFTPKYITHTYLFNYLRNKYPTCKIVLAFRDIVARNKTWFPQLDMKKVKDDFDLVMSYNKYDCEKYGLTYFNTEASKIDVAVSKDYPESDVVFIGTAKDRLQEIIKAYDILSESGFKCFFYVVLPKGQRYVHKGIIFTNKGMSYDEMLSHTVNSRCVLELSQKNEYGFTSRSQEAFMYNKKLITDSKIVKDQRFYPSPHIQFIESADQINPDFLNDESLVDYKYKNEYSPIKTLEILEQKLP